MSGQTISLSGGLEIRDVEQVRARLLDLMAGATSLEVDLSHIAAADTAGVQLLLSLKAEAARRGIGLAFAGSSAALNRVLLSVGMGGSFGAGAAHVD